jgi:hypothetical protein
MNIETYKKNGYRVFRIIGDVTINTDISPLKSTISEFLVKGERKFGILFPSTTYLFSRSIGILVQCYETISSQGGTLAIIKPNQNILDLLNVLGDCYFNNQIQVCGSEEELGE